MSSKNYLFYLVLIFLAATSAQARDEGLFGTIGERIDGLGRNVANIFSPDDNNTAARSKYAQQKTDSSSTFARSNENTTPRAGSVYNSTTPSTSGSTESNTTPNNNASNTRQVQAYRSENRVSTPSNVGATPDTAGVNKYTPSQPTGIYASENLKSSSPYSSNSSVRRSGETLYTADRTASASGNVSTSGSVSNNALISAQAKDSAGRASAASEGGASNGSTVDPSSTEYGRPVGRPLHERLGQSRQSAFDKEKNAALTGKEIVSNAPSTSASENMTATPDNASNTTESAPATSNPTRSNIARTPIASPQAGTNSNVGATSTNNQRPTPAKRPSPTGSLASNATTTKIDTPASSGNAENAANNAPIASERLETSETASAPRYRVAEAVAPRTTATPVSPRVQSAENPATNQNKSNVRTNAATSARNTASSTAPVYAPSPVTSTSPTTSTAPTPANMDTAPVSRSTATGIAKNATAEPKVSIESKNASDDGLLVARRSPVLSVETLGPRKIMIGKESTYEVIISNSGEVAAEDLIVFVSLPEWATVASSQPSAGTTLPMPSMQSNAPYQWKVGRLEAKSREKIALKIIPNQSRPFDLAVRWEYKPIASATVIEVQEPRLELQLDGPREVFYGKKETYRLKILNNGNGNAEGTAIHLYPIGSPEGAPSIYQLGVLPAGEEKTVEVELTARQPGELQIRVDINAEAGAQAKLAEKVLVRRAGLDLRFEGPRLQFVGATGNYTLRLRNPGNAQARNVQFVINLPNGMKYLSGIEDAQVDSATGKLIWNLDTLNPDFEQVYTIRCQYGTPGMNRVDAAVSAEDDLTVSATTATQIDSVANLALDVKDPGGPIAVGDDAIYEIHIKNRGTKDAEGIETIGYFSRGIEPVGAEGASNKISAGQVTFQSINAIPPGGEIVLKVHAKAEVPGNHVFRAEVHCKTLGTRLVSEDNTMYYQDLPMNDPMGPGAQNRNAVAPNFAPPRR